MRLALITKCGTMSQHDLTDSMEAACKLCQSHRSCKLSQRLTRNTALAALRR